MAIKVKRGMVVKGITKTIVLEWKTAFKGEGFIVLAVIVGKGEYVTWWMAPDGSNVVSGHYYLSLKSALEDFEKRS